MDRDVDEEGNAIEGTNNLNGQVRYTWVVGSSTGTGPASNWFNGGLPIVSYEWEIDLSPDFDSAVGDGKFVGTLAHQGDQNLTQVLTSSNNLPVSTVYYLRLKACNLLNGPTQPAVCADDWNTPPGQGATSSTPPPPESVEATVNEDGSADVTWTGGN
jgi:hypothetical protein